MAKSKSDISLNDLKAMLPQEGSIAEQEAALRALTTLSQEDRNLLAAVQESPFRLTTAEQFLEFEKNVDCFVLEPHVQTLEDLGWEYLEEKLTIDLTESTLELKEVESKTEYGLKETIQKMLTDNGAIAGVNSDFFGMAGTYSAGFGPVVRDGELVSAGTSINQDKNQYGTYVKDKNGNSIFTYFKTTVKFSNSAKTIDLASINKVTSMVFPILFNREAATSTADLDKRFDNLVKFVVQNNTITYISQKGETVEVPENG